MPVVGLPVDVADRGAVGIGATGPLAALQALEPRFQFGVDVGILAAVTRMPEMGRQRQQRCRKANRQRRFLAPRAAGVPMIRVFVFQILEFPVVGTEIRRIAAGIDPVAHVSPAPAARPSAVTPMHFAGQFLPSRPVIFMSYSTPRFEEFAPANLPR